MSRTDIEFKTSDRVTLRGWFYTPLQPSSTKRPCVIISHGLSCIKEMGLDEVASRYIDELQLNVLVYDHRGFGTSDTSPHAPRQEVNTYQQASDLRDAITYAQLREEVDKDKIALWGYSLAAALSVYVAAIDKRVKAVIAVGPSLNGSEIVKRLAPPHALNAMQALFEADRIARAQGQEPIRVPIISNDPAVPGTLPSPESYQFFSQWENKEGSTWKNELTVRR
jgi:dienelactone hydrolase